MTGGRILLIDTGGLGEKSLVHQRAGKTAANLLEPIKGTHRQIDLPTG